jgi:hypothetical protein
MIIRQLKAKLDKCLKSKCYLKCLKCFSVCVGQYDLVLRFIKLGFNSQLDFNDTLISYFCIFILIIYYLLVIVNLVLFW